MLHGKVEKIYNDFIQFSNLNKRDGQTVFITYNLLPFYGHVKNIIAEGQTGTGKTLGYLLPLAISRIGGDFQSVPTYFVDRVGVDLGTFLEEKKLDDIVIENVSKGIVDQRLFTNEKMKTPKKFIIVAYTKVLQDQIENEIKKKINPYLIEKGVKPFDVSKYIGKTNYLCLENLPKIRDEIYKQFEEINSKYNSTDTESEKNIIKEKLQEVEIAKQHIDKIIDAGISTAEEAKSIFQKEWDNVIELLSDYSRISLFAPDFRFHHNNVSSPCFSCNNNICPRKNEIQKFIESDIIIMNYHSFFRFFNVLSRHNYSVKKYLDEIEKKRSLYQQIGLQPDIEYSNNELLQKFSTQDEINEFLKFQKNYKEKPTWNVINFFGKKLSINDMFFIFDEAHKFEEVLLDNYSSVLKINKEFLKTLESFVRRSEKPAILINQTLNRIPEQDAFTKDLYKNLYYDTNYVRSFYFAFLKSKETIDMDFGESVSDLNVRDDRKDFFTLENLAKNFFENLIIDKKFELFMHNFSIEQFKQYLENDDELFKLYVLHCFGQVVSSVEKALRDIESVKKFPTSNINLQKAIDLYPFKSSVKALSLVLSLKQNIYIYIANKLEKMDIDIKMRKFKIENEEQKQLLNEIKPFYKDFYLHRSYNVVMQGWELTKVPISNLYQLANNIMMNQWTDTKKIFTSATMPNFDYFAKIFGLHPHVTTSLTIESNFNYDKQAKIYLPIDVPLVIVNGQFNENWKNYVKDNLEKFIFLIKGGNMILTTSNEMHDFFFQFINSNKEEWEKKYDMKIVLFNRYSKKKDVLSNFGNCDANKEKHIGIFGREYFQGIDFKGMRLTNIILPKLPFDEPSSPYSVSIIENQKRQKLSQLLNKFLSHSDVLTEEQISKLESVVDNKVFFDFILQKAVTETKQGIGRAIRDIQDKAVIVILDPRYDNYKKYFSSIPIKTTRSYKELLNFIKSNMGSYLIKDEYKNYFLQQT